MFISIINYDCGVFLEEKDLNKLVVIHKVTDFFSLVPANCINNCNKTRLRESSVLGLKMKNLKWRKQHT